MIKVKKISPKNLTNDEVRAYSKKGALTGKLRNDLAYGLVCEAKMSVLHEPTHYIKLSDIDKEARKQIKELKKV